MPNKILVTYATCTNSTRGVAEEIGRTLREKDSIVDVLSIQDVEDFAPYQAVVVGSPIQDKSWLPEAKEFLL